MNNTLIKGLRLLEVLVARAQPVGISELAQELEMGASNVHRLLQALVELGYAVNEGGRGGYRASLKVWELGAQALHKLDFRETAAPAMRMLLAETNETVHLSVLSGDEVIYIDKLDSPEPVRAYSVIGGRAPAYCVATGKALLAWREQPAVQLMTVRPLQVYTPTTLADTSALAMELDRVRQQGYAVNRGEWRASVWGIAAPVFDERQRVVAALGISGPAERIRARGVKRLAELVVQAARQASSRQLALAGEAR
ncbi:MAG: IclR family transcriptional regulator [Rubrivivax sp.]|uniref:IclR family transcriptional regulator n=1 Tax=Ottowia sp. TaxID=1898956 RepID=UPI0011D31BB9|nr:IclR family transcriptional regulator [Ottowia sp.]MCC6814402.1 IclR family transcriptional regulator [Rubrivivax sp.]MCZ2090594.1 IclR family transcriptional regulator [Burkholderiales bacterium]TXI16141.1 MAG: IclR family transcriptional regulator [Ottowia sp.]HNI83785.1 IclR family transcriptional regulator [Ottowia sp.]HNJ44643.1 IclR family transcriptional regulator [Ottowia sp.]